AVHENVVNYVGGWGHTAWTGTNKQFASAVATFKQAELLPGGCTAAPAITANPVSQAINTGQSATLSVTATGAGAGTLSYQWYQGTAPYTGTPLGTAGTQTVTPAYTTNYWVKVANACGSTPSSTATVTVCTPP